MNHVIKAGQVKKFIACIAVAMFLQTGFSGVLIYRLTQTSQETGSGKEINGRENGFMIIDLDGNSITGIRRGISANTKWYATYSSIPVLFTPLSGEKKKISVLTRGWTAGAAGPTNSPWLSNLYLKGENRPVRVSGSISSSYPRTMVGSLKNVLSKDNGYVAVIEYSIRLEYAESMTVTNNNAGNDDARILEHLIQQFEREGFQSEDSPSKK